MVFLRSANLLFYCLLCYNFQKISINSYMTHHRNNDYQKFTRYMVTHGSAIEVHISLLIYYSGSKQLIKRMKI